MSAGKPARRPNILFILPDQMRADVMGCAGHTHALTPNLDCLAAAGCRFSNAFVVSPICVPSRYSMLTGRYPRVHGSWWNSVPIRAGERTIADMLAEAGYHTAAAGKLHFYPPDAAHGFREIHLHDEVHDKEYSDFYRFLEAQGELKWYEERRLPLGCDHPREYGLSRVPEEYSAINWITSRATDVIRRGAQSDQPWFLHVSTVEPHSPYLPPARFAELYDPLEMTLAEFDPSDWDLQPPRVKATARLWGWDEFTREQWRGVRAGYLGLVSLVDEHVGRILTALDETGQADNTIVVFSSDHGDFQGEHGLIYKEHLYDGSLHVPLIVRWPGRVTHGAVSDALVESIDHLPTLLEMAGVEAPPGVQGRSFQSILTGERAQHRDFVTAEFFTHIVTEQKFSREEVPQARIKSIRERKWKYIHYAGEPGELYDIESDPGERHNLFGGARCAQVVDRLRSRLLDHLVESEDVLPRPWGNRYGLLDA